MTNWLRTEPVRVVNAVLAVISLLAAFGVVVLTDAQVDAVVGVVGAVLTLLGVATETLRARVWSEAGVEELVDEIAES